MTDEIANEREKELARHILGRFSEKGCAETNTRQIAWGLHTYADEICQQRDSMLRAYDRRREDLEWKEALIGVMSLRLAKQRKEIEELRQKLCEKE